MPRQELQSGDAGQQRAGQTPEMVPLRALTAGEPVDGGAVEMCEDHDGRGPKPPASPCSDCPFRRDSAQGVWTSDTYLKLLEYDRPTQEQPTKVFGCHLWPRDDPDRRVCAGWAAVFGPRGGAHALLSLRTGALLGYLSPRTVAGIRDYTTSVALFDTGEEAAVHGLAGLDRTLDDRARAAIDKILRRRPDAIGRSDSMLISPKQPGETERVDS